MLEIRDLSIRLGAFSLQEVTLTVRRGEYLCLAGPTGAGKTILLECIAGLHRPHRGSIRVKGREVTPLPPEARSARKVTSTMFTQARQVSRKQR